jgi:hypothetical protein
MRRVPANVRGEWAAFVGAVGGRLAAGQRVYGDASLDASPVTLANEIEDEVLDLAGWGFLLWRRLRALRAALPATRPPASAVNVARLPTAARAARRRRR